ncbi:T3SS effector NleG family protein [Salmonella enterica]|uniref:T3SS effector NleG family protein n=2 Tax=Salmonella enterica TaxID=28901 RepID=UPI00071ADFBC|nr:DUF1076 domain-containing protein [Salmonella enterica subsp. salamae serovar 56:z10:e,n,x]ECC1671418.1 DUF1076 domain-containing protein [Salmonella enterica subsp. salamae]HCM2047627.1 T3SS effector NleG family protein [Salmonella enterica subsp. salamae serovar 56:z10:e,n,x]
MPVTINLTPYLNAQGELGGIAPGSLESLRHQGQGTRSFQVQLGELKVVMRFVTPSDVIPGHFMGFMLRASPPELLEGRIRNIEAIERLVNSSGRSHREIMVGQSPEATATGSLLLLNRIDSCCFSVEEARFQVVGEHLICPITLCVPEKGVFVRTSLRSDVCCLYDPTALKELVSRRLPHPISREAITGAHIVPKEQCHFDPEKGAFIHSASESR